MTIAAAPDAFRHVTVAVGGGEGDGLREPAPGLGVGAVETFTLVAPGGDETAEGPTWAVLVEPQAAVSSTPVSARSRFMVLQP
jgi:hypothetical protein